MSSNLEIWKRSEKVMPGGVNSPVRAYKSVGGTPLAIVKGEGCTIYDIEGNAYLDFVNSWGPNILGHAHPALTEALKKQIEKGTSFGTVTPQELDLAEWIVSRIPFIDKIRFVNSGTEAVMSAARLARAVTGRKYLIKFEGCYHGHSDSFLVKAGSGMLTLKDNISEASSPGVPKELASLTIVLPLDDEEALEKVFHEKGKEIAAVILEGLPANSGLLKQKPSFLKKVREITRNYGSLLILDEVITGFRLGIGGFAEKYNIIPDLVTYGKIIGGGLPVGAFAGPNDIMNRLAPEGDVYQAGTLSGNPLAMTAGLTVLKFLEENKVHEKLRDLANILKQEFETQIMPILETKSFHINLVQEESIFWLSIQPDKTDPPRKVTDIWDKASAIYANLFHFLLKEGVHLAPSAYEVGFLSEPMQESHIREFIQKLKVALENIE